MKTKFFIFIMQIFCMLCLFANLQAANTPVLYNNNDKNSILHLKLVNNQPFKVILDNKDYEDVHTTYNIKDLESGRHLLVIAKLVKQEGTKRVFEIVFKDHIFINDHAEIFAYLNQNNKYVVFKEINLKSLNNPQNPYLQELAEQQPYNPASPPSPIAAMPPPANVQQPPMAMNQMPAPEFENLLQTIKNKNFDEERLNITQQVIGNNQKINTEQLRQLLQVFSFEKTKVQTAKYCYPYLTDTQNFYLTYNDLKFGNSITELTQFANNFAKKP